MPTPMPKTELYLNQPYNVCLWLWGKNKTYHIPAGERLIRATNLPECEERNLFWLDSVPQAYATDETFIGWMRNYGVMLENPKTIKRRKAPKPLFEIE